jgi:hypothetical protein
MTSKRPQWRIVKTSAYEVLLLASNIVSGGGVHQNCASNEFRSCASNIVLLQNRSGGRNDILSICTMQIYNIFVWFLMLSFILEYLQILLILKFVLTNT